MHEEPVSVQMVTPDQQPPRGRHIRLVARFARAHRLLLLVVLAGVVLRVLAEVAYWPALTFSDSWQYIHLAYSKPIVAFGPDRPSGYPLLLHILALPGRSLATITVVQHLAGLATGIAAYVLLSRLGIRKWVAALAAALILLDSYLVALEQYVMAETFFALALLLCAVLAALYHRRPVLMAASGLLLAGAVTMRVAALFALPAFVLFVLVKARPIRVVAAALAGVALPLIVYASFHSASGRGFGFTEEIGGWALYGRVASIADCRGADIPPETRPICQSPAERSRGLTPSEYVFSPKSPARIEFGSDPPPHVSGLLRDFALAIMRKHPLRYAQLVAGDFGRIFQPGGGGVDPTLLFPSSGSFVWERVQPEKIRRDKYFPGYRRTVREPAGFLLAYQRVFHSARWLMGLFGLAIVVAAFVQFFARPERSKRAVYLLLGGMGLGLVLGSVATVELNVRFLAPAVPLLVCGGILALRDLAASISRSTARARVPTPPSGHPAR
jgi:4-amino-4-deoxy-L-arabinose transferase-like glycosyltransferase